MKSDQEEIADISSDVELMEAEVAYLQESLLASSGAQQQKFFTLRLAALTKRIKRIQEHQKKVQTLADWENRIKNP